MDHARHDDQSSTLLDYVRVVRRRKWILLQATLLVPLAAILFSLHQQHLYRATAEVLLSNQNLGAALTNTPQTSNGVSIQADRVAQTQADVARVPAVAAATLRAAGVTGMTADQFLSRSSASPRTNADLLDLSVTNGDPKLAQRLATAYATEFRLYRQRLDTQALTRLLRNVRARIAQLAAAGDQKTQLYASLVDREQQLLELSTLQTSNAYVVRNAEDAVQVQPKPVRNGILGLLLGIVLGVGLAFLWEALDTRVRSADEVARRLRLPLLGRLPAPPKRLRASNRLAMVDEPGGTSAEPFRMLRTNIDFSNLDRGAKTIMVTSAVEGEGKSTTAANLAVAYARAGRKVVLVDLDLRRPFLHELFDTPQVPGVTNVAVGAAELVEAMRRITLTDRPAAGAEANGNGNGHVGATMEVLPAGTLPPDPGEFLGTQALASVLKQLRKRADIIIVDAAPLLHVGDSVSLAAAVDAILLVTKLEAVRRPMLAELDRLLARSPAAVIGFVATGAEADSAYGYGYGAYRGYTAETPEREKGRVP